jgi:hypothetical protein
VSRTRSTAIRGSPDSANIVALDFGLDLSTPQGEPVANVLLRKEMGLEGALITDASEASAVLRRSSAAGAAERSHMVGQGPNAYSTPSTGVARRLDRLHASRLTTSGRRTARPTSDGTARLARQVPDDRFGRTGSIALRPAECRAPMGIERLVSRAGQACVGRAAAAHLDSAGFRRRKQCSPSFRNGGASLPLSL